MEGDAESGNTNSNNNAVVACILRAVDITVKFLEAHHTPSVVKMAAPKLLALGKFPEAAKIFVDAGMEKEAADAFIQGGDYPRARQVRLLFLFLSATEYIPSRTIIQP